MGVIRLPSTEICFAKTDEVQLSSFFYLYFARGLTCIWILFWQISPRLSHPNLIAYNNQTCHCNKQAYITKQSRVHFFQQNSTFSCYHFLLLLLFLSDTWKLTIKENRILAMDIQTYAVTIEQWSFFCTNAYHEMKPQCLSI